MTYLQALQSIHLVVDQNGKPAAVQMSIETWESLLNWLEETEDRETLRQILPNLHVGPRKSGALRWEDVKSTWDAE